MQNILAALVLGLSVSAAARAESGMYVALDAGQSRFEDACRYVPATLACEDSGTALRIAGGYNFAKLWEIFTPGVEVGLTDLGEAKFSGGGFKAKGLQIQGAGALAVTGGLSVIAKLGAVMAHSDLDDGAQGFGTPGASSTRANGACAIGFQYDFNRQVGVRAQYENLRTFGDSVAAGQTNVRVVSAGVVYRP